jgi:hypothetical protein
MRRTGDVARPTSNSRLGTDVEDLLEERQAICFGFVMHPCMHRRMKSNVSSEPALIGTWCAVPSVGHGARDTEVGQGYDNSVMGSGSKAVFLWSIRRPRSPSMSTLRQKEDIVSIRKEFHLPEPAYISMISPFHCLLSILTLIVDFSLISTLILTLALLHSSKNASKACMRTLQNRQPR